MTTDQDTVLRPYQQTLTVGTDHPALPGHFPGAPVVPGVLLLAQVLEAAEAWLGEPVQPLKLRQAKFPAPWLPGIAAEAHLQRDAHSLRFEVKAAGTTLAVGVFELAGAAPVRP